ncbi:glycosyltransferase family 2 protein [Ferruginibacter sp. SUN002]|uniref:glycosyltransferase family 2 protein n=1 Tax=Ferruginibacter sp. SUN002 TaxID=2937789 RepID=UPI003D368688
MTPLLSVVAPIKDAAFWIEHLVQKLLAQTLASQAEIIFVDSGSTDGTIDILKKYPVQVIQIRPDEFNHGETRNVGVRAAKGKYVVLTVQDAVPENEYWLQSLLDGFIDDEVVAVSGQQIVSHDLDKNPLRWFRPISDPSIKRVQLKPGEFDQLEPARQREMASLDDVTTCYRKEIMDIMPFEKTAFGEDFIWAKKALQKGYALVYSDFSKVYHYHHDEPDFVFKRCMVEWLSIYKSFKLLPTNPALSFKQQLSIIKLLFTLKELSISKKIFWLRFNQKSNAAAEKAYKEFMQAYNNGDAAVNEAYNLYCNKVPSAKKWAT